MIYCVITFIRKKSLALHSLQEKWTYVYGFNQIADNVPCECVSVYWMLLPSVNTRAKKSQLMHGNQENGLKSWGKNVDFIANAKGWACVAFEEILRFQSSSVHEGCLKEDKRSQFETCIDLKRPSDCRAAGFTKGFVAVFGIRLVSWQFLIKNKMYRKGFRAGFSNNANTFEVCAALLPKPQRSDA